MNEEIDDEEKEEKEEEMGLPGYIVGSWALLAHAPDSLQEVVGVSQEFEVVDIN